MSASRPSVARTAELQISVIDVLVGRRLRVLRISQDFAPDAFAAALDIAPERLRCYENGEERIPPRVLSAMADLLRVPMQAFFDPSRAKIVYGDPTSRRPPEAAPEDSETVELLRFFSRITDRALRTEVLNLVAFLAQSP